MELSLLTRLRIAAVFATGALFIGILAWPLVAPLDPLGPVQLSNISLAGEISLVLLALAVGFVCYFVSWPYGREIGILAVPFGLSVWSIRSGSVAQLMQLHTTASQRLAILATFKWETLFWLLVTAAGFAGVLVAQKIRMKSNNPKTQQKHNPKLSIYLNLIIALIISALIAQFFIGVFARDITMFGNIPVSQPAVGQIAFAVTLSFCIAGFVVKKFLKLSYILPILSSFLVTVFPITAYVNKNAYIQFVQHWPANFFPNAIISILPVQMVAFSTFGSIIGYWLAIRYNYWRKHEVK